MPTFLLVLALASQLSPIDPSPATTRDSLAVALTRLNTLRFLEAEHAFLARVQRPTRLEAVLSRRDAHLVARLGCNHSACREDAADELIERGDDAADAILWGRHHKDPEIRDKCERLWNRLFACERCHGAGECLPRVELRGYDSEPMLCPDCAGLGDIRYEMRYVDDEWVAVERGIARSAAP